jgi:hypothetical protein
MISDLVSKLKGRHYADLAAKGKLMCPDCGTPAAEPPDVGASSIQCPGCRITASLEEWSRAGRDGHLVGDPDSPPPGTKIVRRMNEDITTWQIPASGKGGCMLILGGLWLFATTFVGGPMMIRFLINPANQDGDFPAWGIILFWVIGFGILYIGMRAQFAQHLLTVDGVAVTLRRDLFGRVSEKSIILDEVLEVAQKEFYQKNYQPVLGVVIDGKYSKIRFGSTLEDDEKAWLVADLRRSVKTKLQTAKSSGSILVTLASGRLAPFSLPIPVLWEKALLWACIMVVISLAMTCFGWRLIDGAGDRVFAMLWVAIFGAGGFAGVWIIVKCLRSRHQEVWLEGSNMDVSIRVIKHGRVHSDRVFPRNSVTAVRSLKIGLGGNQRKVVLVAAGQSEVIASMVDSRVAADFVKQATSELGLESK